jgi:hypothetical protein
MEARLHRAIFLTRIRLAKQYDSNLCDSVFYGAGSVVDELDLISVFPHVVGIGRFVRFGAVARATMTPLPPKAPISHITAT